MRAALVRCMLGLALLCLLRCAPAGAQDGNARSLFQDGLAAAEAGRWREAAKAFEASLALDDRAATRANLVHAYTELGRPLDVVRHALAFLSLPDTTHGADARARIEAELRAAASEVHGHDKRKNGPNAFRHLRALGLSLDEARKVAGNLRSWWRNSHMALNWALPPSYFDRLGLPRLAA